MNFEYLFCKSLRQNLFQKYLILNHFLVLVKKEIMMKDVALTAKNDMPI